MTDFNFSGQIVENTSEFLDADFSSLDDGNPDQYLTPFELVKKYYDDHIIYNRNRAAMCVADALKEAYEYTEARHFVLRALGNLLSDDEGCVRAEAIEQLPRIVQMFSNFSCEFVQGSLRNSSSETQELIQTYVEPLLIRYIADKKPQVRKSAHNVVVSCLEAGLMTAEFLQLLCDTLMTTLQSPPSDNVSDFTTEAVVLISAMLPVVDKNLVNDLLLPKFATLCSHELSQVRKMCALHFEEVCRALPSLGPTMLNRFCELCADHESEVRQACSQCFTLVSHCCSPHVRVQRLSPIFISLITDSVRWVRMSAFQELGPFISTFAPNDDSLNSDAGGVSENSSSKSDAVNSSKDLHSQNSIHGCYSSYREASSVPSNDDENKYGNYHYWREPPLNVDSALQEISSFSSSQDVLSSCVYSFSKLTVDPSVLSLLVSDTSEDDHVFKELSSPATDFSSLDDGVMKVVRTLSETVDESVGDQSALRNESNDEGNDCIVNVTGCVDDEDSKDSIVPLNEDESDDSISESDQLMSSTIQDNVESSNDKENIELCEKICEDESPDVDCSVDDTLACAENVVFDISDEPSTRDKDVCDGKNSMWGKSHDDGEMEVEESTPSPDENSHLTEETREFTSSVPALPVLNAGEESGGSNISTEIDMKEDDSLMSEGHLGSISSERSIRDTLQEYIDRDLGDRDDDVTGSVVPRKLMQLYMGMCEPEMSYVMGVNAILHCAYSFPAVLHTLGVEHWDKLKVLYRKLAEKVQWKVRKTLASSLHELALIIGPELTERDLLPLFDDFLRDVDVVRMGVLRHLATFLELLRPDLRRSYLPHLRELSQPESPLNWRFRHELVVQLSLLCALYDAHDVNAHIVRLAFLLAQDSVAQVRIAANRLVALCLRSLTLDNVSGGSMQQQEHAVPPLAIHMVKQLVFCFAMSENWCYRLGFLGMCEEILFEDSLPVAVYLSEVLPETLRFKCERVPNVRLTLVRLLFHITQHPVYLPSPDSELGEELRSVVRDLCRDPDKDVASYAQGTVSKYQ